jgi:nucleotide-binding universal stress UspA family protein
MRRPARRTAPEARPYAGRMQLLIVDGANVVGSRPDGWWRDRAAAARRLWEQLTAAELPHDEVVLVLEGAARKGVPAGRKGRVETIHAPGSGDDAIVEVARARVDEGWDVTVVTADRELQARLEAVSARTAGPSWLLDRL